MARYYSCEFENVSVSVAQEFFSFVAADDKPIEIVSGLITQHSDMGEAEEEGLRLSIRRGFDTTPSSGAIITPRPLNPNGSAAGFGCDVNSTLLAAGGSHVVLHQDLFYTRTGWFFTSPPEGGIKHTQGGWLVVRLDLAPADALSMSGTFIIREH